MNRAERDAANNARVLRELERVPEAKRAARFVCVMVVARPASASSPAQVLATSHGIFGGRIGIPPRVPAGGNGFGYDPLFLVAPDFARTGAELTSDEKNSFSHRANAEKAMVQHLHP
jgi:non-canonical purine NTP pyrophosphatase (RdgB/HAM1 family)